MAVDRLEDSRLMSVMESVVNKSIENALRPLMTIMGNIAHNQQDLSRKVALTAMEQQENSRILRDLLGNVRMESMSYAQQLASLQAITSQVSFISPNVRMLRNHDRISQYRQTLRDLEAKFRNLPICCEIIPQHNGELRDLATISQPRQCCEILWKFRNIRVCCETEG